jgi:hypothetical protein
MNVVFVGGTIVLGIARQMEKHCPQAWLFDYANPVAVYSGIVNNHTRIRALGICGGFTNHRWDLARIIFGRDAYPLHQNEPETRSLWKEFLEIHRGEMPEVFQKANNYC